MDKGAVLRFLNSFFVVVFSSFLFFGCASNSQNAAVPSWYFENHQNSPIFLKASAEGASLQEAKNNALAAISADILVQISGKTEKITQSSSGFYDKNTKNEIKSELTKITFTNPIIEKQEFNGEKFYVLVKINKLELYENIKNELEILLGQIDKTYLNSQNLSDLEKISSLQNVVLDAKNVRNKTEILRALDTSFEGVKIMQKLQSYDEALEYEKSNLKFALESEEAIFDDFMKKIVNESGFKISNDAKLKIKLATNTTYTSSKGWEIAKSATTIQIFSGSKLLKTQVINSIGRSSASKQSALERSGQNFYDVLGKSGFLTLLFK